MEYFSGWGWGTGFCHILLFKIPILSVFMIIVWFSSVFRTSMCSITTTQAAEPYLTWIRGLWIMVYSVNIADPPLIPYCTTFHPYNSNWKDKCHLLAVSLKVWSTANFLTSSLNLFKLSSPLFLYTAIVVRVGLFNSGSIYRGYLSSCT